MKYVTQKDKEKINEIAHKKLQNIFYTWEDIAKSTGWSVSTVKKYYDKDWTPGKYFKGHIDLEKIPKNLAQPGLYMLAQQIIINGETINLIKVGKSLNLKRRLMEYNGMNPFVQVIDTRCYDKDEIGFWETKYHMTLNINNKRYGNTEWFVCDDEQYNYWINKKLTLGDW